MAEIGAGGGGSFATTQDNQGLTERCGEIRPVEAKSEFSTAPAPSLREKLKAIRASDHPAGPWARNVVQIMDTLKDSPNDPDLLRALGKAVAMFERHMSEAGIRPGGTVLTPSEIAAIFGLGTHQ